MFNSARTQFATAMRMPDQCGERANQLASTSPPLQCAVAAGNLPLPNKPGPGLPLLSIRGPSLRRGG